MGTNIWHIFQTILLLYNTVFISFIVEQLYIHVPYRQKNIYFVKGNVLWDFWPLFFHDSNLSGLLTNRLKYFCILFWFRKFIHFFWKLCDAHPIMESISVVCTITDKSYSAVCITPLSQTPQRASYCGVNFSKFFRSPEHTMSQKLCGLHHTARSISVVWIPPRSQTLRIKTSLASGCF